MRRSRALARLLAIVVSLSGATVLAADGTITGTVRLEGPVAKRPPLPVYKHAEVCGEGVEDERLVVGPSGGVRYAVVSLEGVRNGRAVDRSSAVLLDTAHCRFGPPVQVAEGGQVLEMHNSDPILHNVDARQGGTTLFNVALPPGRRVRKTLETPGLVAVTCDVRHTWMSAVIAVATHPYHTVTDLYGAWEIRDVPPGRYKLRVWHEQLGVREQDVEVPDGGTALADTTYPADTAH
jgi:hypothetical protein